MPMHHGLSPEALLQLMSNFASHLNPFLLLGWYEDVQASRARARGVCVCVCVNPL